MSAQHLSSLLARRSPVYASCAFTLALGLFFIFVWAPHPFGWEGIDEYDQLALDLANRGTFPTMDRPWGYALFVAIFYRLFGHHRWIPLVAQAVLNGCMPLLVFLFAREWLGRPTSVLAAILTGLLSFNTVYVSTLSTDAVCTVIFMAALVAFAAGERRGSGPWYALAGLLAGIAAQFRPNLVLVPLLFAAYAIGRRVGVDRHRLGNASALLLCAAVALMPWIIRNYRLTRSILPTTVHGGAQFWYGTLQVGPYLNSRAHNPRSFFEAPVFDYTSLDHVPMVVTARLDECTYAAPTAVALVYWTDYNADRQRIAAREANDASGLVTFEIPATRRRAVVYYYFDVTWSSSRGIFALPTPLEGDAAPFVYFVSDDHLGDLDLHGDLLDVFDLVRMARHVAWHEPLPFEQRLAAAGIAAADVETAVEILLRPVTRRKIRAPFVVAIDHDPRVAQVKLQDGSSIAIPRLWDRRLADLTFDGPLALALMTSKISLSALALRHRQSALQESDADSHLTRHAGREAIQGPTQDDECAQLGAVSVNHVFYREEPAMMRRYEALALDNIRRAPSQFALASLFRMYRLFVIEGTDDRYTTQQFRTGSAVYRAATIASSLYLLLLIGGIVIAKQRGYAVGLPLGVIAYFPLTIAFVLTNMRYSITVQPVVFMFVAVALGAALERIGLLPHQSPPARAPEGHAPAGR